VSAKAARSLYTYFDYDKNIETRYRNYYSDAEWEDMLIAELEAGRPMLYSGTSPSDGGHAFVCDGYDGNGYFHFNWGWKGYCDSYFLVSGTGALENADDGENTDFVNSQMVIANIMPNQGGSLSPVEVGIDGLSLDVSSIERGNNLFTLTCDMFSLLSPRETTVRPGVMLKNGDDVYCAPWYYSNSLTPSLGSFYTSLSVPAYSNMVPKNGTYEVYPIYMDMNEAVPRWRQVKLAQGLTVPTLTVTGTEPTLALSGQSYASSGGKRTGDNRVTLDELKVHVNVEAISSVSSLPVTVYVFPSSGGSSLAGSRQYVTLSAGQTSTLTFNLSTSNLSAGTSYLVLVYDSSGQMCPSGFSRFNITVVDEMPSLRNLPETIESALQDNATMEDVITSVRGVLY